MNPLLRKFFAFMLLLGVSACLVPNVSAATIALSKPVWRSATVSGTTLCLSWSTVFNARSYTVYYKSSSDSRYSSMTVNYTSTTLCNATPGKTYYVYLVANPASSRYRASGCSSTKTLRVAAVTKKKLAAPTVTLYSGYRKITVGWVNKALTEVYMIAYRRKGTSTWKQIYVYDRNGSWISASFYTIENLTPGATYEFRVGACATNTKPGYVNSDLTSVKQKSVASRYVTSGYRNTFVDYNIQRNSYAINFY